MASRIKVATVIDPETAIENTLDEASRIELQSEYYGDDPRLDNFAYPWETDYPQWLLADRQHCETEAA